MENQRLTYLLQQHLADKATRQEQQELLALLQADTNGEEVRSVIAELMQAETPVIPVHQESWQAMVQGIVNVDKTPLQAPVRTSGIVWLYRCCAAAIVIIASMGLYYFLIRKSPAPVAQNTPMHFNEITTAPGDQKEVVLPDGSHLWLHSASSIRYPDSFSDRERTVTLSGEAWFDVEHADKIPFVIHTGEITTQVIGTAFDIKAYPAQKNIIVSVQRGKVRVSAGNQMLANLEKGKQVRITGTTAELRNIDIAHIAAWKSGNLYYKDEMLADIIADLQRVFNVSIQVKRNTLKEVVTTAAFNKDIGIRQALDILCRITDGRLSQKNGIYIIE
ncbi:DUF4974 domain-containing protein [Niastella caeni]|uniref:DUF4974 domain-containing protein n=1 Tax=Niastella caeni TaxID=2569763 RepID=A0A4S8HAJ1_9BACT|nr:FecR family protein [Niastella caeni]THU30364.1 DUF4974 domain-containing protein [Niastella caeni]